MSADSYFECHVTLVGDPAKIKPLVENLKWKFSAIDGDPTLGDGVKCYATRHFNARVPVDEVLLRLHTTAYHLSLGAKVIREKIEHVIYDSRLETVAA